MLPAGPSWSAARDAPLPPTEVMLCSRLTTVHLTDDDEPPVDDGPPPPGPGPLTDEPDVATVLPSMVVAVLPVVLLVTRRELALPGRAPGWLPPVSSNSLAVGCCPGRVAFGRDLRHRSPNSCSR